MKMHRIWIALVVIAPFYMTDCRMKEAAEGGYPEVLVPGSGMKVPDSTTHCNIYHPWLNDRQDDNGRTLRNAISPPDGFFRMGSSPLSDWLRCLPVKPKDARVHLYDGSLKYNQNVAYAVLDMDVGHRDLQQCADAVMRLHAEYLFAMNQKEQIAFSFTSGDRIPFSKYMAGNRPMVRRNSVLWKEDIHCDSSYAGFRDYMDIIFTYAGTASLERELEKVEWKDMQPGDVIIHGGHPGHAVTVLDVAINPQSGEKVFLIAQSYMPAQEIHVLVNENDTGISPWYSLNHFTGRVHTPEWDFTVNDLRRFKL